MKNQSKNLSGFPLFILIVLFTSCDSNMYPVEVDLSEDFVPEVVISSFLNPDSSVKVLVGSNQIAFSKTIKPNPNIISATITDVNNNQIYNLSTYANKEKLYLISNDLKPKQGGIYKIRVETKNPTAIVEVTDTVPSQEVKIIELKNNPIKSEYSLSCSFSFIPVQSPKVIYYELVLYKQYLHTIDHQPFHQSDIKSNDYLITREDYYPDVFMLEAENPLSLLFRIDSIKDIVNINFVYDAPFVTNGVPIISTFNHNIKIQLRTVSRSYFKYKTTLYTQEYAALGDLLYGMPEPVKVFSNIKGGLGIIGSFCKTDTTIWVAGRPNVDKD